MTYRGVVEKGKRRGSALGFPTANIAFDGQESGIYAARVRVDDTEYHAAVYADARRKVLEAHLGKYDGGDLYDKEIEIELLKKIREDREFIDDRDLKEQIQKDILEVVAYFRSL